MKKLGILGVLILLVALVFVPQGVMAASTSNADLTINGNINNAIEVNIEAFGPGGTNNSAFSDDETYAGPLVLDPSVTASPTQVAVAKVQTNFKEWDLQVSDSATSGNMTATVGANSYTLNHAIQIAKIDDWGSPNGAGGYPDVTVDDGDMFEVDTAPASLRAVLLAESPRSKDYGAIIPIVVKQVVDYDDAATDDDTDDSTIPYSIVLTFTAGHA